MAAGRVLGWVLGLRARRLLAATPWTQAPALVNEIRAAVEQRAGRSFNSVLLNYYRTGSDSQGWHSDDEARDAKHARAAAHLRADVAREVARGENLAEARFRRALNAGRPYAWCQHTAGQFCSSP